jgi:uncharacterized protein YqgV (UPF0045/DUF77 family)
LASVRLRVEFTTEPFDLDRLPRHAAAAREVVRAAELDSVDVGPFGNTAEGGADAVLAAVDRLLRTSLAAGATRVSLQVNVVGDAPTDDPGGPSEDLGPSGVLGGSGDPGPSGDPGGSAGSGGSASAGGGREGAA